METATICGDPIAPQPAKCVIDYGKEGRLLSAEQRLSFERDGFLLIPNLVPQRELDRYHRRFREICEGKNVPKDMTVAKDASNARLEFSTAERTVAKLRDMNHDPVLFDYCKYPPVVSIVEDLIGLPGDNIMAMHGMLINKPPDTGNLQSRHPMHQDLIYFPFRPAEYICCAWTAMENVHRQNGCLIVVPGSHKMGQLRDHGYPKWEGGVNPAYYGVSDFDPSKSELLHVEMKAGDTLFFHPLLIHGSGANRTNGFRKSISCHYANGDRCNYVSVKGTNQEPIEQMTLTLMRKHFRRVGLSEDFQTFADYFRSQAEPVSRRRAHI